MYRKNKGLQQGMQITHCFILWMCGFFGSNVSNSINSLCLSFFASVSHSPTFIVWTIFHDMSLSCTCLQLISVLIQLNVSKYWIIAINSISFSVSSNRVSLYSYLIQLNGTGSSCPSYKGKNQKKKLAIDYAKHLVKCLMVFTSKNVAHWTHKRF